MSKGLALAILGCLVAPIVCADDVADYYLKLPPEIYQLVDDMPTLSLDSRKEMVALERAGDPRVEGTILLDVLNGYLEVTGSDSGERHDLTMALYRQKDHSALIALTADENFEQEEENGGGPATHYFAFYLVQDNIWKDVTKQVAPKWPIPNSYVVLPRYGTSIKIYSRGKDKLIAVWRRQGDGFVAEGIERIR